ncbi:MAG: orotate phosphoribosyltransferase, orotate phosphoribosyltransferase [Candidatus Gottesmanbacteria bacterium GW2011_GWA2_43_14]|uniref:Orotate phosphoribosyltransferase n=1 Tax=Candidatus Gottesmanbacteria bacterium GW2011_GWA2_43_14 TaxID=1618443 RepID=A0A0G1DLN6_9BACT|nr:MAG: orotate phosphoribosyltransferase, orotate phosphoribosyltransferase [Candidatus Gottesmanbacteria bacterium GW2011_GWA2_43_14]
MNRKVAVEAAKLLLEINAMTFRFNPPYTFTSGLKSPVYLDNRLIISYPEIRRQIINYYIETIKSDIGLENVDWISATASAAIPHGAWVADRLKLPMVFVRPSTKTYGKGGKVEGYLLKGSKVLIVEDHISSAESVSDNAKSIRDMGGLVEYCIATTTYETEKSIDNLKEAKIKLVTLTTGKVIVETAREMHKITQEEKEKIDLWFKDPPNWAMKQGLA